LRKGLTISAIVIIILCVLSQLLLPGIASRTVTTRLSTLLDTQEISAEVSSFPALLLGVGHLGSLEVTAQNGRLGKVRTKLLHLKGSNVSLDPAVVTGGHFALRDADELKLEGVVTEANLEEYLEKSVKKLKNAKVTLTKKDVFATGKVKLLGKEADVSLEGYFEAADEGIYLKTRRIQITNSRLGRQLDMNMFGDFLIVDVNKLNMPVSFDKVEQEDGQAIVYASYRR